MVWPFSGWQGPLVVFVWWSFLFVPLFAITVVYQRRRRSLEGLQGLYAMVAGWGILISITSLMLFFAPQTTLHFPLLMVVQGLAFLEGALVIGVSIYNVRYLVRYSGHT
jgi:hypothetical protein